MEHLWLQWLVCTHENLPMLSMKMVLQNTSPELSLRQDFMEFMDEDSRQFLLVSLRV